jgi:hypothetical protein
MTLTRRQWFAAACGAAASCGVTYGFAAPDFWNRKDPAEWTPEEIARLLSKSPWAKGATMERVIMPKPSAIPTTPPRPALNKNGTPKKTNTTAAPRPSAPKTQPVSRGIIVWESAKPVRDARKMAVGGEFAGMYVISAAHVPLIAKPTPAMFERLRRASILEIKGKDPLAPALVTQAPGDEYVFYFGFPRQGAEIVKEDKEITFITHRNNVGFTAKFNPREMLYHGELAD